MMSGAVISCVVRSYRSGIFGMKLALSASVALPA